MNRKKKLSKSDKGKGLAAEASKKKTHHPLLTLDAGELIPQVLVSSSASATKELYNDLSTSASLLSKITYPGESFPIPDALGRRGLYDKMSSCCVKIRPSYTPLSLL